MAIGQYFKKEGVIDAVLFLVGGIASGFVFSLLPLPAIATVIIGFALVVVGFSIDGKIGAFLVGLGAVSASGILSTVKGLFTKA
jgi:xanthosine utilization system XapX-like protein